jgi:hypothetical protein
LPERFSKGIKRIWRCTGQLIGFQHGCKQW